MALNLIKLSVGTQSVEGLEDWIGRRAKQKRPRGFGPYHDHITRMHPKRADELLDGGSIYWVIKGVILCRQTIAQIKKVTGEDGIERSALLMDPPLIRTQPQMRRAFQGWRYLRAEDAPADLGTRQTGETPPDLHLKLAELGLL